MKPTPLKSLGTAFLRLGLCAVVALAAAGCGKAGREPAKDRAAQPTAAEAKTSVQTAPMDKPEPRPADDLDETLAPRLVINGLEQSQILQGQPIIIEADWPEGAAGEPSAEFLSAGGARQDWPLRKLDTPRDRPIWVLSPAQTVGLAPGNYILVSPAGRPADDKTITPVGRAALTILPAGREPGAPPQTQATRLLVRYHLLVGELDAAGAVIDAQLDRQGDSVEFWTLRGDMLMERRQYEQAAAAYAKALGFRARQAASGSKPPLLLMEKWQSALAEALQGRPPIKSPN